MWTIVPTNVREPCRQPPQDDNPLLNIVYPVSSAISPAYDVLNRLTNMMDFRGQRVTVTIRSASFLSEDVPVWANDTFELPISIPIGCGSVWLFCNPMLQPDDLCHDAQGE